MFYPHVKVPQYMCTDALPQAVEYELQVVGDLSARSGRQQQEMYSGGFFADARTYICMVAQRKTIAWFGFDQPKDAGVVTVTQVQGRQNAPNQLPRHWPRRLFEALLASAQRSMIHTVQVRPARLQPWWPPDHDERLQNRLRTYYDWVPKRLGFTLASPELQQLYLQSVPVCATRNAACAAPYHTLRLQDRD